jgi:hypothetical protein
MDKNLLEQMNNARAKATTTGPEQQKGRNDFYSLVWNNWDAIATSLDAQVNTSSEVVI